MKAARFAAGLAAGLAMPFVLFILASLIAASMSGCSRVHIDADIHPSLIPLKKPDEQPAPPPKPCPWRKSHADNELATTGPPALGPSRRGAKAGVACIGVDFHV